MTTETNAERLARITKYVNMAMDMDVNPLLSNGDLNWLIARAELAEQQGAYIDGQRKA